MAAVFLTFFFHEISHWAAGELLGYKMTMTLNSVSLSEGKYRESWHDTLVSAAGPVFTLLQASAFYMIMRQHKNLLFYPFLFTPLYMRALAGAMNFINLNDEGRISHAFGIGTFTLSVLVCLLLFFYVYRISKQNNFTARFQIINLLLTMLFSSILILADQSLHIKMIN
jgi:Na+/H+-translocating membrane pyrophosphatase